MHRAAEQGMIQSVIPVNEGSCWPLFILRQVINCCDVCIPCNNVHCHGPDRPVSLRDCRDQFGIGLALNVCVANTRCTVHVSCLVLPSPEMSCTYDLLKDSLKTQSCSNLCRELAIWTFHLHDVDCAMSTSFDEVAPRNKAVQRAAG